MPWLPSYSDLSSAWVTMRAGMGGGGGGSTYVRHKSGHVTQDVPESVWWLVCVFWQDVCGSHEVYGPALPLLVGVMRHEPPRVLPPPPPPAPACIVTQALLRSL